MMMLHPWGGTVPAGTPLQNGTAELWSLLNFVDRRRFASKAGWRNYFKPGC